MSDRLALANAIEDAGIERAKAERVASVIFDAIHDNVATKAEQASEATIRGELRGELGSMRALLATEPARLDTQEAADAAVEEAAIRTSDHG